MKRHELIFWIIKLPIELVLIFFLFFFARQVRLVTDLIPWVQLPIQTIDNLHLWYFAAAWALLFAFIFMLEWLYEVKISSSKVKEFFDIIKWSFFWFFIFIALLHLGVGYLFTVEIPRLIPFFVFIFAVFAIAIERIILNKFQDFLLIRWKLEKRSIVFLMKQPEEEVMQDAKEAAIYDILWYFAQEKDKEIELSYLGAKKELITMIQSRKIDEILVIQTDFSSDDLEEIFEHARIYGVRYRYITNYFDASKTNTELTFLHKMPFIEIKNIGLTPWGRVIKRAVDIVSSLFGLILLSPLFLVVSLIIFLTDFWYPFYTHERIGKDGKPFMMYKFRSMIKNAEKLKDQLLAQNERQDGPMFKISNDPRITRFWKFIRKFDIDELPQLINVLIGNMSLVWPRPHLQREIVLYKEYQKRVLTIKPGITGMAQTHGRHNNTFDDEVKLDTSYIENWSLLLDVKILIKTISVVLGRKGA